MMLPATIPDTYIAGRVISRSPLITFSAVNRAAPLGLMSIAPDLLGERAGLHLLHHTWTLERGDHEWIAEAVAKARHEFPKSHFVMLTSNDLEAKLYGETGEACIVGSSSILTDERVFRPVAPFAAKRFDATYVARLDVGKRHELATSIDSLQLIYGYALDGTGDPYHRIRKLLPRAYLANHDAGRGQYSLIPHDEVVARLAQSEVALCLSAEEGAMRASMEYLLCGMPVVSTESVGGRDRYFVGSYCRIVDDHPDAVASAVHELKSVGFDRRRIREHIGQLVAFERHNLRLALNGIVKRFFAVETAFHDLSSMIGVPAATVKSTELYQAVARTMSA